MLRLPLLKKLAKAAAVGFLCQEAITTIQYYQMVGLEGRGQIVLLNNEKIRVLEGEGQYLRAPLWEPELGVIRANKTGFVFLHELGHHYFHLKTLRSVIFSVVYYQWTWPAIIGGIVTSWLTIALEERLADHYALQRCTPEDLKIEIENYEERALRPTIYFPPDLHPSDSDRAFALTKRLRQLQASPSINPIDLPCPRKTLRIDLWLIVITMPWFW